MNKQKWIDAAKEQGFEQFEIYEQRSTSTSIEVYKQNVDSYTISDCDGIAMRGLYEGKMGNVFLEEVDDEHMDVVLNQMKENARIITSEDKVYIQAPQPSYPEITRKENELLKTDNDKKIALLKELDETLQTMHPAISQVMETGYSESVGSRSIFNSKGLDVQDEDSNSIIYASILLKDGEETKSCFDWRYFKSLESFDVSSFAKQLCELGLSKLHSDMVESGTYPVLMKREAMTSLFSALCGLYDGENAYKGISILKDKLHTQIFDEKVTIVDDPFMDEGVNSCGFDDEGSVCQKKDVVKDGVLQTYLHNTKSAMLMNTTTTGNGFKAGYGGPVGISPTNFYIENGTSDYQDLIASMEKGIIVTELNGLHAGLNPISCEFSLQSEGFLVENGKIVKPIHLFTIAGNYLEMMKHIEAVGNDLRMGMNGVGTPSILFSSIAVSGK